ncbi:MAG TPA: hypothetical protein VFK08_01645 [Rhodanobacteraceae bacterium]|jgi:hypothetical protein|nr:hypothetical protein [Rhodanobacteraceae bacterium]
MTFSAIPGEFEEVCQRHDAFVEQGRLELIAEQGTDHDAGRVAFAIERSLQELTVADSIEA